MSDPASPRYGKHLSAAQVCEIVSCPDRKDAVQRVLEWLLGPRVEGGRTVGDLLEAEEERVQGRWLRPPEGGDDVAVKVTPLFCFILRSMGLKRARCSVQSHLLILILQRCYPSCGHYH